MKDQPAPLNRQTGRRFVRAVKDLLTSEVRRRAIGLLVLLLAFALSVNGLNVVNSYVGRDFMTAIAQRDMPGFIRLALLYVCVFAGTTIVAVLYRFTEERLGLLWRSWLTQRVTKRYLERRTYFRLRESAEIDNPDQRIADDIRAFTATTLSFTLIFLNGTLAAISFSGVLWAISPVLFGVAVAYAALGTLISIYLGRPLIGLNYRQSDCEADFRASLIHVRENAESIAVLRREGRLKTRLLRRIDELVANFRRITSVNRNLGFFTTGYNYLIQIIPTLIIAPSFIRGDIEFGVITQSAMAFSQLLGAFSLIVNQFGAISSFAAVVARLGALAEAVEGTDQCHSAIETVETGDQIVFDKLTLRATQYNAVLIADLSLTIPHDRRLLVHGNNEAGRTALFRAIAGIWPTGKGRISRPPLDAILFLAQKPYLAPGTLRDVLVRTGRDQDVSDEQIKSSLHEAGLASVLNRAGGLDVEVDWANFLSLREQQQLVFIRLSLARPHFAVLDRVSTALGSVQFQQALRRLKEQSISYLALEETVEAVDLFDDVLEINDGGRWNWRSRLALTPPT